MSWFECFYLMQSCDGDLTGVDASEIARATAKGHGDAESQVRIARAYYNNPDRKEANHGQTTWEFG